MVLTSRGNGKYVSKEFERIRKEAVCDKSNFTGWEQDFYDIEGNEGTNIWQEDYYYTDTIPVEPFTPSRRISINEHILTGD